MGSSLNPLMRMNYHQLKDHTSLFFTSLTSFTAIHVETGHRNTTVHMKVTRHRYFILLKRMSLLIWSKIAEREREALEMKAITRGKTVPYKCCLPGSNKSVKKNCDTDFLYN